MTTYNTGNPIGSTDARDLYDNAQNLDNFANGAAASYSDRFGVSRRSLAGIDAAADNVLNAIGYSVPVAYASGISLTLTSQTVDYNGVIYAPKSSALPFTTSSWGTDSAKFRAIQVTDADLITYTPAGTGAVATTVKDYLDSISFTKNKKLQNREWKNVIKLTPASSIQAAIDGITNASPNNTYLIILGDGTYNQYFIGKDYVDVIGSSIDGTILTFSGDADTANIGGCQMVMGNMTIYQTQTSGTAHYAIHIDSGGTGNPRSTVTNIFSVKAYHTGGVSKQAIGIGVYGYQKISFDDVYAESSTSEGIFAHNMASQSNPALLSFTNVISKSSVGFSSLRYSNSGSGQSDVVVIAGGQYQQGISSVNSGGSGETTIIADNRVITSGISSVGSVIRASVSIDTPSKLNQYLEKVISLDHYQLTFNGGGPSYRFPIKLKYQLGASGGMQLGCTSNGTFELQAEDGTTSFLADSSGYIYNNGFKFLNKAGTGYSTWASRNAAGTAAYVDLNNIGEIVTNGAYRGSGNFTILNKAGNGWLTWAARSTSGAEAEIVLTNLQKVTSARMNLTSIPAFANNAAAITGGLTSGEVYRTSADPSVLCVVV